MVLPEPEVVETSFSADGTEVALFPDAVSPLRRSEDGSSSQASPSDADGSKLTGILIGVGVAAAVFAIAFVAFGRRGKSTHGLSPPPPPDGGSFRG